MRYRELVAMLALASLWCGSPAVAQEKGADNLELTMTLLPETATVPDAVTKTIELPAPASEQAGEHSASGTATANQSRERREAGLDTAAAAREQGRQFGQDMAAEAQQNREDHAHGNPPSPPDHPAPPDHPSPPNPPGPPGP
jgi:hypothetical protein